MKKMRHLSAITLAMVMAAAGVLTGCGGNSTGATKAEHTETKAESASADTDSA